METTSYQEWKQKREKEFNELPIAFAFNDKQLEKAKEALNCKSNDELRSIGYGGFVKKENLFKVKDFMVRGEKEFKELCKNKAFAKSMFIYELNNHEYSYTLEEEDTLNALGISYEEIYANPTLKEAFNEAKRYCIENACF